MAELYDLPCSIEDVVSLVGLTVIRRTPTQLDCHCPFCGDKGRDKHLNVNLRKNVFRCNRCNQSGGVYTLYALIHNISIRAARHELKQIFPAGVAREPAGFRTPVVSTPELDIAPSSVRNNTYRNLLDLLSLSKTHRESLLRRGLSNEEIIQLGYRTTPAVRTAKIVTGLLDRGCKLGGVPGFYRCKDTGMWQLDIRASGIMIPNRNCRGEIEAIQIRLDQDRNTKFNTLTSADQYYGTSAHCCPHFVGLSEKTESLYVTEGIMKADIAHKLSCKIGSPIAFVGLTGVGNTNQWLRALEELRQLKIERINVAVDMDFLKNENVRISRDRIINAAKTAGFTVSPITWAPAYKGIDDFLLAKKLHKES